MDKIKIKDLYAGKPDAKDEIDFEGPEKFIRSFVVAEHFNLDLLTKGNHCFITGFKGTGKTALLFYLEEKLKAEDPQTCASYIFFKEDFTDIRRNELHDISKRILSAICIEQGALTDTSEFEYVWRWILLKRLVSDNEAYNRNLFVDNAEWAQFENIVAKIKDPKNKRKIQIPNTIKFSLPIKDSIACTEISPEVEVDFRKQQSKQYQDFVELVDIAEELFGRVTRTEIPYFIFTDELEAYYGDPQIFKRDLYMIRDLIFTVKRYNSLFTKLEMKSTKIICSVRTEIINAITRFIVTKEINKVISGFSVPLNWNYSNNNSYAHPIIQILLKRIAVCADAEKVSNLDLYREWFPEPIHDLEPASYILNNSWYKPRDMIRLLISAQNSLFNESSTFSTRVFDSIVKTYSEDSLQEIKEELRALYTSEQIDCIISCFTGYKTVFSVSELQKRIQQFYKNTILETAFIQVLNDLYRLGFIGNILPASKIYHWQHRGDSALILSDSWRICIHYALQSALSLNARVDHVQNKGRAPQEGDTAQAVVNQVKRSFAYVDFMLFGKQYMGQIHISEFGKEKGYIHNLVNEVHIGDKYAVVIDKYIEKYKLWNLKINQND